MMRTTLAVAMFVILALMAGGCRKPRRSEVVTEAFGKLSAPKESKVTYAAVPAGTKFLPQPLMGVTNPAAITVDGHVFFIDEQPGYDWAHNFQLVFIPNDAGEPIQLFKGSAVPGFTFKKPDGTEVTSWEQF